jgi:hypothetical protein
MLVFVYLFLQVTHSSWDKEKPFTFNRIRLYVFDKGMRSHLTKFPSKIERKKERGNERGEEKGKERGGERKEPTREGRREGGGKEGMVTEFTVCTVFNCKEINCSECFSP